MLPLSYALNVKRLIKVRAILTQACLTDGASPRSFPNVLASRGQRHLDIALLPWTNWPERSRGMANAFVRAEFSQGVAARAGRWTDQPVQRHRAPPAPHVTQHLRRTPALAPFDMIAAHCEACLTPRSITIATAHSRTSGRARRGDSRHGRPAYRATFL